MSLKIKKVHNKATRTTTETVEFEVLADADLKNYAITDNTYDMNNEISNVHQHFYKFPHQNVVKGDKVILHTGKGTNGTRKKLVGQTATTYDFYCGSDAFIWNDTGDVVKLYRLGFVEKLEIPPKDTIKKFVEKP